MPTKDTSEISFQIMGMEILDSCLNAPSSPLPPNSNFQFELGIEHRFNIEKKLVIVICNVSIKDQSKDILYGQLRGSCIFFIEKSEDFFVHENKSLNFPEPLIVTLNSITISSIRGLMFSFFRGTFLHQAVLPIIDPKSFQKAI